MAELMMTSLNRNSLMFVGSFFIAVAVGLVSVLVVNRPAAIDHSVAGSPSTISAGLVRGADVPDLPFRG